MAQAALGRRRGLRRRPAAPSWGLKGSGSVPGKVLFFKTCSDPQEARSLGGGVIKLDQGGLISPARLGLKGSISFPGKALPLALLGPP